MDLLRTCFLGRVDFSRAYFLRMLGLSRVSFLRILGLSRASFLRMVELSRASFLRIVYDINMILYINLSKEYCETIYDMKHVEVPVYTQLKDQKRFK